MASIRRNLCQYLFRCSQLELMAERLRQKIAANPYFQVQTVFERFDRFSKGHLVPDDLAEFMLDNQIYPTEVELYLLFRDFDKERVGVVTLQKLAQELLPKQNQKALKLATEKRYYKGGIRLQIDLQYIIAKYFEHKLKEMRQLSVLRTEMFQKQLYTVQQAFTLLDYQKQGVLSSIQEIDQFMRNNGKALSKEELNRIFRVLSFDSGSQILYDTFQQHLDPLGKGYYIGYSQRLAEKNMAQQEFIRQKFQVNSQIVRNTRERLGLSNTIADLRLSNRRLEAIVSEQELQKRAREEELLGWRMRWGGV